MKALIIGAALVATALAVPASAEVVVRSNGNGVVVREHSDRGHHYGWRNHHASCKTVTVRRHRPNGSVVITKRRVC